MARSKPRISEVMKKNVRVKCPFCGYYNTIPKIERNMACGRCRRSASLDEEYLVDKYY